MDLGMFFIASCCCAEMRLTITRYWAIHSIVLLLTKAPQSILLLLARTTQSILLLLTKAPQSILLLLTKATQSILLLLARATQSILLLLTKATQSILLLLATATKSILLLLARATQSTLLLLTRATQSILPQLWNNHGLKCKAHPWNQTWATSLQSAHNLLSICLQVRNLMPPHLSTAESKMNPAHPTCCHLTYGLPIHEHSDCFPPNDTFVRFMSQFKFSRARHPPVTQHPWLNPDTPRGRH